ncbi:hypothetical protein PAPYR_13156 [Paratrimastix pyriformis]|uniref:Uncharacterized protein n=1 Tax=Paratrimastix pyriformis TaxID=342808 RepID=A0ABQ8U786_9EUKA|nr:hypothetical protein PAPYR_13156 [Paratrimastix pyriformis]
MLGPNVATAMGGVTGLSIRWKSRSSATLAAKMQADLAAHSTQATHRRAPTGACHPGRRRRIAGAMGWGYQPGNSHCHPWYGRVRPATGQWRPTGEDSLEGSPSYEPLAHDLPTPPSAASSTTPLPGGAPALGFVRQLRQSLRAPAPLAPGAIPPTQPPLAPFVTAPALKSSGRGSCPQARTRSASVRSRAMART